MIISKEFDAAFKSWFESCKTMVENDRKNEQFPDLNKTIYIAGGRKYAKIVTCYVTGDAESVWAFVDTTNGDVLKPASWRAPAKHARGNIFDKDNGLGSIGPYGPAYL